MASGRLGYHGLDAAAHEAARDVEAGIGQTRTQLSLQVLLPWRCIILSWVCAALLSTVACRLELGKMPGRHGPNADVRQTAAGVLGVRGVPSDAIMQQVTMLWQQPPMQQPVAAELAPPLAAQVMVQDGPPMAQPMMMPQVAAVAAAPASAFRAINAAPARQEARKVDAAGQPPAAALAQVLPQAPALPRSAQLHRGDVVRVRNSYSDLWEVGTVSQPQPLLVMVRGHLVPTPWKLVQQLSSVSV